MTIDPLRKRQLLNDSLLAPLPDGELRRLADVAHDASFRADDPVLIQGERGDDLFLIDAGMARTFDGIDGNDEIATLDAGEVFGELSVLGSIRRRSASVTALTDLRCLVLPGSAIRSAMDRNPEAADTITTDVTTLATAAFLRRVAAFAPLDDEARRSLATKLTRVRHEAGSQIITLGDASDYCFVVLSGEVEVRHPGSSPIRTGAGALLGELGLLTGEPRSATVVATEPSTVLRLGREDLLAAMERDPAVEAMIFELLRLRGRPVRADGVEAHHRRTEDGESYTILKDPVRGVYFRLSPLGWFVWERLDGTRNVRDLALAYLEERRGFAPEAIATLIAGLARSGFLGPRGLPPTLGEPATPDGILSRFARRSRSALTWHIDLPNVDGALTRAYAGGMRLLFTRPGQALLGLLAVVGAVATVLLARRGQDSAIGAWWWFMIPGIVLSIGVHEAGHAFTTKAVGREVRRAGVGWFWIGPMAFVDTSDAWLATRRQRLYVALAGPYATILFAGACAIVGLAWPAAAPACFVLAISSYVSVITNLNPLIELDGYYTLVHLTDRPNLRTKALGWLATEGPSALRHPSRLRGHGIDAAYALASVAYLVAVGVIIVLLYRAVLQRWVAGFTSPGVASVLAWAASATVCLVLVAGVAGDLIQARERVRGR